MCLAIPARILSIDGEVGTVDLEGTTLQINLSFVENAAVGKHVLIHAGFALEVLTDEDAAEIEFYRARVREAGEQMA